LFVVHPSLESEEALANLESEVILPYDHPLIVVWRAAWFGNPSWLKGITCLQMSDTGLFLNWDPTETLPDFEAHFNQSLMDDHWFRGTFGFSLLNIQNNNLVGRSAEWSFHSALGERRSVDLSTKGFTPN